MDRDVTVRFTRRELAGLLAARIGNHEGQGPGAFIELRVRVTPELLDAMLGGHWVNRDGSTARFEGVEIQGDLAQPILARENQPHWIDR